MKHEVITAVTFLFLHTQGAFIGVSDDYYHDRQLLRPSQSTNSKSQLYSWYGEYLSPKTEKYFPYQYDKILQLKRVPPLDHFSASLPYTNIPLVYYPRSQHEFQRDVRKKISELDNNHWKYVNEKSMNYQSSILKRVPSLDDHLSASLPYTNIPLVYYPPSQHEFQRDVQRKISELDNNQWKYVNEKSMNYQSSKLNLGRYERNSILARKPWYTYYPYYYSYEVPYPEHKISQSFKNIRNSSQLTSKFQMNTSQNYIKYHHRGNKRTPDIDTSLEHFSHLHPGGYIHHRDQILKESHDPYDHSSEIFKENENVNYEEVFINDGQKLENKETLLNKDQNKTITQNLLQKSEKYLMPKGSQDKVAEKPNPEKKQKPQVKSSKKGKDKRVSKGSIAIKVRHKRSIPVESGGNDDEIQPRIFGAIGNVAKGIRRYFFGSSDPETVIMYQGPNGNVQLTEKEFAMLMQQQQQNGLQLSPEQFYMKNRVGEGPPVHLTQEQLMMLMQQQQQGSNMPMQLTPEQIAVLMQQQQQTGQLSPDQIAALMQQQTQQQPGQLTPDQLAVLMQQQQQTGQLSPDQVAALMQQSQSPQQLTPEQIAVLMQQQQQQLQMTSSVSTQVSGPYVHTYTKEV